MQNTNKNPGKKLKTYAVYQVGTGAQDDFFVYNIEAKNQWHARRILKGMGNGLFAREITK